MNLYIQLLEVFAFREIKSRYKASILGPLWIIINPLLTAIMLSVVFGIFVKIKTDNIPYFLFVVSGLLFWNFFQQGFIFAKDSLVWGRELVVKTVFPKDILPLSYILSKVPDFLINLAILICFYLFYGFSLDASVLLIVIFLVPTFLFVSGISLFVALCNSIFRDFRRVVELFMTVFFYMTPIIYPESFVPEQYNVLLMINPLALAIIFTRDLLFKHLVRIDLFVISISISIPVFFFGYFFFKKYEKKIVDLI